MRVSLKCQSRPLVLDDGWREAERECFRCKRNSAPLEDCLRHIGGEDVTLDCFWTFSFSEYRSVTVSANRVSFVKGLVLSEVGERTAGVGFRV